MLTQRWSQADVEAALRPGTAWVMYPSASRRHAWEALPAPVRQTRLEAGQARLGADWSPLPATVLLDFARHGHRSRFEALSFARRTALGDLVLAECVEGRGRFVEAIVDGVWAICEESYWGVPAHLYMQRAGTGLPDVEEPTVDLFAAETASLLAWTLHLVGEALDGVSPLLRRRLVHETRRRVLEVLLERDDFGWMGLEAGGRRVNNWNPWICSNWLATALLVEGESSIRAAHLHKAMRCLDRFLDPYPADGGCDEGPGYWGRAGASLFDALETLHAATGGVVDLFAEPLVGEMGRFVYRVHIAGDDYVNFADAPAVVHPDAALVYRYGQAVGDAHMTAFGAWLAARHQGGPPVASSSPQRALRSLFTAADLAAVPGRAPLPRHVWLPVIEVMTAREAEGAPAGFFVAAKGGHNDESHNHNDVGQFVVYVDGAPVVVDAGVESYTRRTFSPERYQIWTMQSAYHNLPTIGQMQQRPGPDFRARQVGCQVDAEAAQLELDIAAAYPEGTLTRWRRRVRLVRRQGLIVTDEYALGPRGEGPLVLSLMTACAVHRHPASGSPAPAGAGDIDLRPRALTEGRSSGAARLHWEIPGAQVEVDEIAITDARLGRVWGGALYRLRFTVAAPPRAGRWQLRFERAS